MLYISSCSSTLRIIINKIDKSTTNSRLIDQKKKKKKKVIRLFKHHLHFYEYLFFVLYY